MPPIKTRVNVLRDQITELYEDYLVKIEQVIILRL